MKNVELTPNHFIALEVVTTPLVLTDGEVILWANTPAHHLSGHAPHALNGVALTVYFDDVAPLEVLLHPAQAEQPANEIEAMVCPLGINPLVPVLANAQTVRYEGQPARLLTLRDIRYRRTIEARLSAETRRLNLLMEHLPVVLWATDRDDILTVFEGRAMETIGVRSGDLLGYNARTACVNLPDALEVFDRSREGVSSRSDVIFKGRYYEMWAFPIVDPTGRYQGQVGLVIDNTDKQEVISALTQTKDTYRHLIENLVEGVYLLTPDFLISEVNTGGCDMTGFSYHEVVGRPSLGFIHPDDRAILSQALNQLQEDSKPVLVGYRVLRKDGEYLQVESSAKLLVNGNIQLIERDVSERLRIQQTQLERELIRLQYQKERELNQLRISLMHTVSHELRTPLSVIMTATELLERYQERLTEEKRTSYMRRIRSQVEYLKEMLQDISFVVSETNDVGKVYTADDLADIDLRATCENVLRHVERTIGIENSFLLVSDDDLPHPLRGNEHHVRRVIFNLLSSAVKHTDPHTMIYLHLITVDGGYLLQVADDGKGRDPAEIKQLLDHRRRQAGEHVGAVGLGLTIVRQYIALLNGMLHVEKMSPDGSTPGAVFTVYLPDQLS